MIAAFVLFAGHRAQGQALDSDGWHLSVTPYFWFSGIEGDVKVRDAEVDVDVGFDKIWDALDFGAQVHIEAQKGRWGLLLDPTYLALSVDDESIDVVDAELEIDLWIVEFGGFYRIVDSLDRRGFPGALDVLLGGRYWSMETQLDIGPLSRESNDEWVDPFFGLRWTAQLTDKLLVLVRGDVGGFAIYEDASDFTWNVFAGPAMKLSKNMTLLVGYRALGIDRDEGDNSKADLTLAGPEIGLQFQF
ncbi:MAG: hypothetical protein ACM3VT_10750 [Solirubrobacterales bacterium]